MSNETNMLIEGENLEILEMLSKFYNNKIDLIIVDPPYNTKVDYLEYKDNYNGSENWVLFMKERLFLAYKFLSDTGIMFTHIDENELVNLAQLYYKMFNKENVAILVWKKINPNFDKNRKEKPVHNIKSSHEYIILCCKNNIILSNIKNNCTGNEKFEPMESIIDGLGTTSSAKDELEYLLKDKDIFSTPKPMKLIKEMIRASTNKYSIILDFFAGSGTTAHAIMDLNKEDNGSRKFILINNDENDICRNVTLPRIKQAIKLYDYLDTFNFFTKEDLFVELKHNR